MAFAQRNTPVLPSHPSDDAVQMAREFTQLWDPARDCNDPAWGPYDARREAFFAAVRELRGTADNLPAIALAFVMLAEPDVVYSAPGDGDGLELRLAGRIIDATMGRQVFTAAGAPITTVPANANARSDGPRFLEWEREAAKAYERAEADGADDDETEKWSSEAGKWEALIRGTPGTSRDAMLVKARLLRLRREFDLDEDGVSQVDELISYMQSLPPEAAVRPINDSFQPADWMSRFEAAGGRVVLGEDRESFSIILPGPYADDLMAAGAIAAELEQGGARDLMLDHLLKPA